MTLVWTAAAVALAAALVRELGVAFLLIGFAASFASPEGRRREWIPWALSLAATVAAYAAHFSAARAVIATLDAESVSPAWLHPDGLGLVAAVSRVAGMAHVAPPFAWALLAAAVLGALAGTKGLPRLVLSAAVVAGAVALALLHPTGYTGGSLPPGYWGDVVFGTVLATAPLALLPLARIMKLAVPVGRGSDGAS